MTAYEAYTSAAEICNERAAYWADGMNAKLDKEVEAASCASAILAMRDALPKEPAVQNDTPASEPVMWRREWEGDESDLGQWVYADTEEERDEPLDRWQPLYEAPQPAPPAMTKEEWDKSIRDMACAISPQSETPASPTAKVPEGWTEALRYLHLSTASDGQWADQAVHGFVGAMLAAAPQPATLKEGKS